MTNDTEARGGDDTPTVSPGISTAALSGTANQVEWAERIRRQVSDEFDRVAASFRSVACKQSDEKRADTEAILAILEDNRAAAMSRLEAGYFIRDWQEISDQVRQMIGKDSRYQAIQARRAAQR
jgi:hypothetical protein